MNKQIAFLAAGIVAGAIVFYFLPKWLQPAPAPVASEEVVEAPAPAVAAPAPAPTRRPLPDQPGVKPQAVASKPAPAPVSAWARLSEKYGPEKTALSSKITSNLTSVINEGMELANAAARNAGAASVAEAASREVLRNASGQLGLTDAQHEKAAELIQSAVNKRMTAVTDLTSAMSTEPEQIMEMLLAGDALARNQITREEYDRLTQPTRAMLQNVAGFITGRPGAGGAPQLLLDPDTTAQLNAILTPEQQTKLAEMTATITQEIQTRQAARSNAGMPFQIGQLPVMDLERLDQSVASMKQMAEAARLMMDAMKGLQEANPNSGTVPR